MYFEKNVWIYFLGPVNNFLKWRPFVVLSRLTYSAYLTNGLIELHNASILRVPVYLSVHNLVNKDYIFQKFYYIHFYYNYSHTKLISG